MDPKIPTDKKHQLVKDLTPQEVTVEMLTELDRLVQLLESPIFTPLRMEVCVPRIIVDVNCATEANGFSEDSAVTFLAFIVHIIIQLLDNDQDLISALYGLLMLLPQVIKHCNF